MSVHAVICVELDRNKETLRRDIALLDDLHEQTKSSLGDLDAHIAAGIRAGARRPARRIGGNGA
jgi:uncharacterized protein YaaN involved in tellurite resistance